MPPPTSPRSTRWCFTLNNYTEVDIDVLRTYVCKYVVFGYENAPTTNTPHLQGFIVFNHAKRLSECRQLFNGGRGHFEITRGSSHQAAEYCKKAGHFVERGVCPGSSARVSARDLAVEWARGFIHDNRRAPTQAELAAHSYATFALRNFHQWCCYEAQRLYPVQLRQGEPRTWQRALEEELVGDADDRSIVFYLDPQGSSGKSWFQQWFLSVHPEKAQLLAPGRVQDIAFLIDESKDVFLMNVPRGGMEYLQYSILEQLKDRVVISTKYETKVKYLLKVPHVVVFCNEAPDETKLSFDRFDIRENYNY